MKIVIELTSGADVLDARNLLAAMAGALPGHPASPPPAAQDPAVDAPPAPTMPELLQLASDFSRRHSVSVLAGLLEEFNVKRVSELAPDQLGGFADAMRGVDAVGDA